MLRHRVIPILLLSERRLVKTLKFSKSKYVGDPINIIKIFNDKYVDELIVIDIDASKKKVPPDFKYLDSLASECFMPLTYGGGIKNIDHAEKIFQLGIEKVCIQSALFDSFNLVHKIASRYGSQSIVLSVDLKKSWRGKYSLYDSSMRNLRNLKVEEFIQNAIDAGVGEVLLTNVEKEGTLEGPDLAVIETIAKNCKVPLIVQGGVSSLTDMVNIIKSGADSIAAGAFFIYSGPHRGVLITYPKYEQLEFSLNKI